MTRSSRPHVLLVHDAYLDYVTCLANALSDRVRVTLLHSTRVHSWMRDDLSPDVRTLTYRFRRIRDPRRFLAAPALGGVASAIGADVIHVQQSNDPWFNLFQACSRQPTVPWVATIHDLTPHPGDGARVPGGHVTLRLQRRRLDHFLVHYPQMCVDLAARWKIRSDRIDIVPHGELGSLYLRRAPVAARPRPTDRVLFFGRIWPYKGLDRLIRAMNILAADRPGLTLTIAGTGEHLGKYLEMVEPQLTVEVLDRFVRNEEVAPLFECAAAVCLPYVEASQSGVHALACGLGVPVVATDVAGLGAAVAHERDGLVVPPDDVPALARALARLIDDSDLRDRLAAGARRRSSGELSWTTIAEQTVDVYRRVQDRRAGLRGTDRSWSPA